MCLKFLLLLVSLSSISIWAKPVKENTRTSNCVVCHPNVEGKVNIHLVAHSHDDAGWLKTVDQYYFGSGSYGSYEGAGVQYIISTVMQALKANPDRRYIQVETEFFWKWWQKQSDSSKQTVRELIKNGQLEFVNAAMSMNDEATTNYQSIIDQYTWGFRLLNDTLGDCARSKVGWQIDPFGHSREHASINLQLGFEGLILGRIDYRDKDRRRQEQDMELMWKTSASSDNSSLFTMILADSYVANEGFRFDVTFQDTPINDDPESPGYNLPDKVHDFANILDNYRTYYKTDNILMPMGGDFTYQDAELSFINLDRLIKGFENHDTYNLIYSTPSCYVEAVTAEIAKKQLTLSEKSDDFFPYASDEHSYWSGYFSSRPTIKRFERLSNNILQAVKQLAALSKLRGNKDPEASLNDLRENLGIMQHHDAITGTEKQAVAEDYARRLAKAVDKAQEPVGSVLMDLLPNSSGDTKMSVSMCILANISVCEIPNTDAAMLIAYNPLSKSVDYHMRVPVDGDNYEIVGPNNESIDFDIVDSISSFEWINDHTIKPKEIVFLAQDLPPLGFKIYSLHKSDSAKSNYRRAFKPRAATYLGNENTGFTIDEQGKLSSIVINGESLDISQEFLYYLGSNGADYRPSGAYVFRPTDNTPIAFPLSDFTITQGDVVDEVLQIYNKEVRQIIRVYKDPNASYIEFDWLVGDLQFEGDIGKEVITRFTVDNFSNKGIFFTDSNGRERIRRELNKRPDYDYDSTLEPVASNYYPVTSKIAIQDNSRGLEVAILTDRAQGGASLQDGVVELMVHRRLTRDDAFGVGEALNEVQYDRGLYARGSHWLVFGPIASAPALERDLEHRKLLEPVFYVGEVDGGVVDFEYRGLTGSLPENVKLLTLEPWFGESILVRLEHIYEKGEDEALSKTASVDLTNLIDGLKIGDIIETTLGGNQKVDDGGAKVDPSAVSLEPMQIRTFIIIPAK